MQQKYHNPYCAMAFATKVEWFVNYDDFLELRYGTVLRAGCNNDRGLS